MTSRRRTLRVLTFNILRDTMLSPAGSWTRRRPAVFELLKSSNADVLCLQEPSSRQCEELEAALADFESIRGAAPAKTRHARPPFPPAALRAVLGDPQRSGSGCPIFVRRDRLRPVENGTVELPLDPASSPRGLGSFHYVNRTTVEDTATGATLAIYNTHLGHLPAKNTAMARDLRTILDRDTTGIQILCGDMNSLSSWRAMRTLRGESNGDRRELVDAWRAAERRRGPSGTLHLGVGIAVPRIDYVFVRPKLRVPQAEVIVGRFEGRFPSDHCALLVELEVPAAASA